MMSIAVRGAENVSRRSVGCLPASAAAATAAVAAAATAAAAAPAAAAAAAPAAALLAGLGDVHGEGPAVVLLAVQRRDGGLRLLVTAHLHETEPLAPAGVAVLDDLGALDGAVGGKHLLEVRAGH